MIMFLSFLAAVSTKVAVEMILSGAAASVTLHTYYFYELQQKG